MIEIIFNNETLELFEDTRVPLNFKASLAESIGEFISNYSNTFEVPTTDHNLGLIENANMVASNSRIPYKIVECKLLISGRDLFGISRLVILDINAPASDSPGTMRVAFIAGRGSVAFGGSVRDLDLSALNFVYDAAQAAARANNTTGVLFAPVNYGVDLMVGQVDINYTHFSVYVYTILQQILKEAGVTVERIHPANDFIQRVVIPVLEPKQLIAVPADFIARRSTDVGFAASGSPYTIVFDQVIEGNEAGYYNAGTGVFTYPQPSKFTIAAKVRVFAPLNGAVVIVSIQGLGGASGQGSFVQQVSDGVNDLEFDVNLQGREIFTAPLSWSIGVQVNSVNFTVRAGALFGVEVSEDFVEGQTIDVARSLPDMTQGELFTQVSKMVNLIVSTKDGVTRLMAFDRLTVSDRLNWSDRMDTRRSHQINFQSRFGRSTFFRYSNDNYSPSPTAGDAVVAFDNEVLPATAEAVKLVFAGAEDVAFAGAIVSMKVPRWTIAYRDGNGTASRNGGGASTSVTFTDPHNLRVGSYIFVVDLGLTYYVTAINSAVLVTVHVPGGGGLPAFSGSAWQYPVIVPNNLTPRIGYVPASPITGTTTVYRGRSGTANVTTYRQVRFTGPVNGNEGLNWATLLTNYFLIWLGAMERFQLVRAWLKLTDNDVYQFDFTASVYIEKLGSEFYVQSINQYDGDEDPTEVELLALAEALDPSKITPA